MKYSIQEINGEPLVCDGKYTLLPLQSELEFWARIQELEEENKRLKNLQDAWQHVNLPEEVPVSYAELLLKIRELEDLTYVLTMENDDLKRQPNPWEK